LKLAGVWIWSKFTTHIETVKGTAFITNVTYPKKERYNGNIYLLIDGFTASSACFLAANLKYKANAICLGQETAGGETGCNANSFQTLVLPNSKIKIQFPIFRFNNQIAIPENHQGIIPDYYIDYSANSYLQNKDLEIEKVLELIN
jgi:C-terminal processing protease CtpA/Prc